MQHGLVGAVRHFLQPYKSVGICFVSPLALPAQRALLLLLLSSDPSTISEARPGLRF